MLKLRDIMTSEVLTVSPELSLREAMEMLARRHVSGAPVVANGEVLGVVSATDLLQLAAALPGVPTGRGEEAEEEPDEEAPEWEAEDEPPGAFFTELWSDAGAETSGRMDATASPEWNPLEEHTVSEAMTADIVSLPSETPVEHAADAMNRRGIHRVLVMDEGKLVGIVSALDVAKAVAEHKFTARTYIFASDSARDEREDWEG
ncbi:MAG TPA: CBS domain-containing protein [Gemmatimonadaceae bacterium]|nr:CBS domain-containing protein [Gemmatimonadaceae bacterium]